MQDALENKLSMSARAIRDHNEYKVLQKAGRGPHAKAIDVEVIGTELDDILLHSFAKKDSPQHCLEQEGALHESDLLMQDQRVASWARRYARKNPM